MKLKTIVVSVLVLLALSAVFFVVQRPAPPVSADVRLGQPLVERGVVEKAARVRLSDQGKTVTLARETDGTWKVTSYHDLPADLPKLASFVDSLTSAKIERLVTSVPERVARLEFKDTKVALLDAADKELWGVTLGKNPDSGSGRYVQFGTEQKGYLATLSAWLDSESKNWANAELLNLKADDVAKVEIPFAEGGPVVVSRAKKEDAWTADKTPANQKVNASRVSSVLSTIGALRFSETNDPADPLVATAAAHARAYKVTTFDGKTVTVTLARKPEEKKLKPPAPTADGKSGPAALGSVADLAKKDDKAKAGDDAKPAEAKPLAPEYETIPAGPVFVTIAHSDAAAPINARMKKRAFQIADYTYTGLPQKSDELFEAAPPPEPPKAPAAPADAAKPAEKPAEPKK